MDFHTFNQKDKSFQLGNGIYAKSKATQPMHRKRAFHDKEKQRTRIFMPRAENFNESADELTLIDAENKVRRIGKKLVLLLLA
jgi:hypothetical protein